MAAMLQSKMAVIHHFQKLFLRVCNLLALQMGFNHQNEVHMTFTSQMTEYVYWITLAAILKSKMAAIHYCQQILEILNFLVLQMGV